MVQLAAPKNRKRTLKAVRAASFGPLYVLSTPPPTSDTILGSDKLKVNFLGVLCLLSTTTGHEVQLHLSLRTFQLLSVHLQGKA